ncbi:MAG: hypothetical protein M2R45_03353 [Verrucomicrobia subdivision 3 bacterium]|nr:hypothetical protein [Limisphaerales bacterium]
MAPPFLPANEPSKRNLQKVSQFSRNDYILIRNFLNTETCSHREGMREHSKVTTLRFGQGIVNCPQAQDETNEHALTTKPRTCWPTTHSQSTAPTLKKTKPPERFCFHRPVKCMLSAQP